MRDACFFAALCPVTNPSLSVGCSSRYDTFYFPNTSSNFLTGCKAVVSWPSLSRLSSCVHSSTTMYVSLTFPLTYLLRTLCDKIAFTTPSDYDLPHNDVKIQTSDKVTLSCYLMECQEPRATILMFHGNAMDHGSLLYQAIRFYDLNCNVLTVSYRGFPGSGGVPSERGGCFAFFYF